MSLLIVCDGCGRVFVDAAATADDVAYAQHEGTWDGPCERCGSRDVSWCDVPRETLMRDLRDACLQVGIETN